MINMNFIVKVIKKPVYYSILFMGHIIRNNINFDKFYLKLLYRKKMKRKLNLEEPKTFNEKLQWLKIYDRNLEYTKMVDKNEAKKYVSKIIGEDYIIPTIGVWNNFNEIDFNKLPNQFVLKCTHDSGGIVICKDKAKFNINKAKKIINHSLKRNYFLNTREWPYKNIKPRIIAEKYMVDESGYELKDYKLMCFNGKVKCSFVCSNRNTASGLCVNFYDQNWKPMPFERHYPKNPIEIAKPNHYKKMVELAEKLSKNIPFVRVDFYIIENKIYFGELTFYPGGGMEEFTPEIWDYTLGSWLNLPKKGEQNE